MTVGAEGLLGQRVLVTGASGFLGTHTCRRLGELGIETHAVARNVTPGRVGSVVYERADLTCEETVRRVLRRSSPDVVLHLAGRAAARRSASLVQPTLRENVIATVNVLGAAVECGAPRVVLPGSLEEPGPDMALASSPYAISKSVASAYGRMFERLYKLPVAIARLFLVYGPTTRDLHKLIPYLALSLLLGIAPRLSSGLRRVDWIYVDDAVEALLTLATAPAAVGATTDIGSGQAVSIREIALRVAALADTGAAPIFDPGLDRPDEQLRIADLEATIARIGWAPRIGLDAGLAATIDWFRQHQAELRPAA